MSSPVSPLIARWADRLVTVLLPLAVFLIPLAFERDLYHQTELPKRILGAIFSVGGAAAVILARLRRTSDEGADAVPSGAIFFAIAAAFVGFSAWHLAVAPFARSTTAAIDPSLAALENALLFLLVILAVIGRPGRALAIAASASAAATIAATFGLLQYAAEKPGAFPFSAGPLAEFAAAFARGEGPLGRLRGLAQTDVPGSFFGHTNMAAEYVGAVLPLTAWLAFRAFGPVRRRLPFGGFLLFAVCLGAVSIQGLFLVRSGSRAVMLAVAAVLGLAGLVAIGRAWRRAKGRRGPAALAALAVIAIVCAGFFAAAKFIKVHPRHGQAEVTLGERLRSSFDTENTTFRERLDLWANTSAMIRQYPVFGVGPGNFRIAYPTFANAIRVHEAGRLTMARQPEKPHNIFLEIVAETGFVGGVLFAIGVIAAGVAALRILWSAADLLALESGLPVAAAMSIGVLLFAGSFSFPFVGTATRTLFFVATAILAAASARREARGFSAEAVVRALIALGLILLVFLVHLRARVESSRALAASRTIATARAETDEDRRRVRREELRRLDQAVARTPSDDILQTFRAEVLRLDRRTDAAEAGFHRALDLHPNLINARVGLAEVALERGDFGGAVRQALDAVAINPFDARARTTLATAFSASGDRDRALTEFEAALDAAEDGPTRLTVLVNLALLFDDMRDAAAASQYIQEAENLAPNDRSVVVARARITERSFPGTPQSMMAWSRVLEVDPADVEAKLRVGLAVLGRGQAKAALALFDEAYALEPSGFFLLYHRAEALGRLGRFAEARDSLFECMKRCGMSAKNVDLFERCRALVEEIDLVLRRQAELSTQPATRPASAPVR